MLMMFTYSNIWTALTYFVAAVAPAVILLSWVRKNDRYDIESPKMIRSLLLGGLFAVIASIVLEVITDNFILPSLPFTSYNDYVLSIAITTGLIEEITKYYFLYRRSWYSEEFNFRFDGIVYAVTVGLGFAAIENITYIFQYGLSIALQRALLAIPAHMTFGILMGLFYGRAKVREAQGRDPFWLLFLGVFTAVAAHAFYDGVLMLSTDFSLILFAVFVIFMYLVVFFVIRKEGKHDRSIYY